MWGPRVSDSLGLGRGLWTCIFSKCPGVADACGLGTTVSEPLPCAFNQRLHSFEMECLLFSMYKSFDFLIKFTPIYLFIFIQLQKWFFYVRCFLIVQSLSHVRLFATPWMATCLASLSFTNSWSSLKLMSIELVMLSNHLILCRPLLLLPSIFPSIKVFSISWLFAAGGQSIRASVSVLPMSIEGWFPLGLTGLIYLLSKQLSRVFSNTRVRKQQYFSGQPSLWSTSDIRTWLLEKP